MTEAEALACYVILDHALDIDWSITRQMLKERFDASDEEINQAEALVGRANINISW